MLAVLGQQQVLRTPVPKARRKDVIGLASEGLSEAEEEAVYQRLAPFQESLPHRHRAEVKEVVLGPGTGVAYVRSSRITVVDRDGVTVVFCGYLGEGESPKAVCPGADAAHGGGQEGALRVLELYKRLDWAQEEQPGAKGGGALPPRSGSRAKVPPAVGFGELPGAFALLLIDRRTPRTVAARDGRGHEPLFWGAPTFGDGLIFSTDRSLVEDEAADADQFPPGALFSVDPEDGTDGVGHICNFEGPHYTDSDRQEVVGRGLRGAAARSAPPEVEPLGKPVGGAGLDKPKGGTTTIVEESIAGRTRRNLPKLQVLDATWKSVAAKSVISGPRSPRSPRTRVSSGRRLGMSREIGVPDNGASSPIGPTTLVQQEGAEGVGKVGAGGAIEGHTGGLRGEGAGKMEAEVSQLSSLMKRVRSSDGLCRTSSRDNLSGVLAQHIASQ